MITISIDPGASGAIAWHPVGGKTAVEKMPETEQDIYDLLYSIVIGTPMIDRFTTVSAYMENVPIGMPGKGAASSKLNANAGFIRGVLTALGARIILIRPAKWQKHFSLGSRSGCASDSEWKNKLKAEAQRRYPGEKVTLDKADALLILDYAKANPNA